MVSLLAWPVPFWGGRNSEGDEGVAVGNALVALLDEPRTLARLDLNDFYTSTILSWCESMLMRAETAVACIDGRFARIRVHCVGLIHRLPDGL